MDAVQRKESLAKLALRISRLDMNLRYLRTVIKPIRGVHRLSYLELGV